MKNCKKKKNRKQNEIYLKENKKYELYNAKEKYIISIWQKKGGKSCIDKTRQTEIKEYTNEKLCVKEKK